MTIQREGMRNECMCLNKPVSNKPHVMLHIDLF